MSVVKNEKGMVLLVVLMIITLLAVLLTEFSFSTLVDLRLTETFRDSTRAYYLARGGVTVGRMFLKMDTNGYDAPHDPAELWSQGLPSYPVGGGFVSIQVEDLGGKLALNRLVNATGPVEVEKNRFMLLCELLDLAEPQILTDSLIDWLDADDEPRTDGAESGYYLQQETAYPAKNAKLETLAELELVRGFTPEVRQKLEPHVTLYGNDKLNVNSVSPEVLAAVFAAGDTVSLSEAESAAEVVIAQRDELPIKRQDELDLLKDLPELKDLGYIVNTYLGFQSGYFMIRSDAEVNDGVRSVTALVDKQDRLLQQRVQ